MKFHSIIYRELGRHSPDAAAVFLKDFREFQLRRQSFKDNEYDLVVSYFFQIFSTGDFPHELRCISGNRHSQHLWMEDFRNVIMPSFISNYPNIITSSRTKSDIVVSELGRLLGVE